MALVLLIANGWYRFESNLPCPKREWERHMAIKSMPMQNIGTVVADVRQIRQPSKPYRGHQQEV